jgi:hypothetical protein
LALGDASRPRGVALHCAMADAAKGLTSICVRRVPIERVERVYLLALGAELQALRSEFFAGPSDR